MTVHLPATRSALWGEMASINITRARNALWSAAALFIVVAGMREAQSVLVPVVLSVIMAVIASPGVKWLARYRVPKVLGVILVVSAMMGALVGITLLLGGSFASFKSSVPLYEERLGEMANGLFAWAGTFGVRLDSARLLDIVDPGQAAGRAMAFVGSSLNALAAALSNTVLVVLTMVLILLEADTVPRKLRVLAGDAFADISHYERIAGEVQAYLFIKTVLSIATGVVVAVWAAILGVDFALLWGLIAFLLNYIPNIGSIVAAVPAMLLALVQHGPGTSLALGAGYVVVNMVLGNMVEPMWMGRKLGLSTTVVFLSLVVWGWVWGPVGMLLSVPLTMVLKIMLGNSKEWSFIAKLLDVGREEQDDDVDPPPLSIIPITLRPTSFGEVERVVNTGSAAGPLDDIDTPRVTITDLPDDDDPAPEPPPSSNDAP